MLGKKIEADEFVRLLNSKKRVLRVTARAKNRSEKRIMPLRVFEDDLKVLPSVVFEQVSDLVGERKFNVYYRQVGEYAHRYVLCLNNELRLITLARVTKEFQRIIAGFVNELA